MGDRNTRVFNLLKEQQRTKADMADALGVSRSAITQWEKNGTEPSYEQCRILSKFFNTSMEYLLDGTEPQLENVYLSFAKEAQDEGIDPEDIKNALDLIKKLRGQK